MKRFIALLLGFTMLFGFAGVAWGTPIDVTFRVTVPDWTPPGDTVHIAGTMTGWSHAAMTSIGGDQWEWTATIDEGTSVEYKYTRGNWGSVETAPGSVDIPNRTITVVDQGGGAMLVTDTVEDWKDIDPPAVHPIAVTFRVTVPDWTPPGDTVHIAGTMTGWSHSAMTSIGGGQWEWTATIDEGTSVEYKYTRGNWGSVETHPGDVFRPNRVITVVDQGGNAMLVTDAVEDWEDIGPPPPPPGPTPPRIDIRVPEQGAVFILNEPAYADWSVYDVLLGLDTAVGTTPVGGAINTSSVGLFNFAVTVTDLEGNVFIEDVTYRVVHVTEPTGAAGTFLADPRPGEIVGIARLMGTYFIGEIIPLSFRLGDIHRRPVEDAVVSLTVVKVELGPPERHNIVDLQVFAYDDLAGEYLILLDTADLSPGIYDLWIGPGGGDNHRVRIALTLGLVGVEEIASFTDPIGDDHGMGSLVYPTADVFDIPGLFDLLSYTIFDQGENWLFVFEFYALPNPWGGPLGFSHPIINLYLDVQPGGLTEAHPDGDAMQVRFHPDHPWDFFIKVAGWSDYGRHLFTADGETHLIDVSADPARRLVLVRIPKDLVPEIRGAHYVIVASQDGFGPDHIRPVARTAGEWVGGGSPAPHVAPLVFDYLAPAGYTQEEILAGFCIEARTFAVLVPVLVESE